MAVIRFASTPMVDLTALVKKDTCWQTMASLVKVCVYACQLVSDTGLAFVCITTIGTHIAATVFARSDATATKSFTHVPRGDKLGD